MTADKKTTPYASQAQVQQDSPRDSLSLLSQESPGVKRVEIISSHIHLIDRVFLFSSVFLIAYVYGLDNQVRQTYQVWAFSNMLRTRPVANSWYPAVFGDSKLSRTQLTGNNQCFARCDCSSSTGTQYLEPELTPYVIADRHSLLQQKSRMSLGESK